MGKCLLFFCFLLQTLLLSAQVTEWARTMNGPGNDSTTAIASDAAGNVYVAGTFTTQTTLGATTLTIPEGIGWQGAFLAKYNASGVLQWARQLSGATWQKIIGIRLDEAGNAYVAGQFLGIMRADANTTLSDPLGSRYFLIRFSPQGTVEWARQGITYSYVQLTDMSIDRAGYVYVTGNASGTLQLGSSPGSLAIYLNNNVFLVKYDPGNGMAVWARSPVSGSAPRVGNDAAGNSYLFFGAGFTAKLDPEGQLLHWKQFSTDPFTVADVAVDNAGNLYATGNFFGTVAFGSIPVTASGSNHNLFLLQLDAQGDVKWAKVMGTRNDADFGYGYSLAPDGAGNLLLVGIHNGTAHFDHLSLYCYASSIFAAKFTGSGEVIWAQRLGRPSFNGYWWGGLVSTDAGGNAYVAGMYSGRAETAREMLPNLGNMDGVLVRLSGSTNVIKGKVFLDLDNNGVANYYWEKGVKNLLLEVMPGHQYVSANASGEYEAYVGSSDYTVRVPNLPRYHTTSTPSLSQSFSGNGSVSAGRDFAVKATPNVTDLSVTILPATDPRPGSETYYYLNYRNEGTLVQSGAVALTLDQPLAYQVSSPAANVNGNQLTWSFFNLEPGETRRIAIGITLSASVPVGTAVTVTAAITPALGADVTPADNSRTDTATVAGSSPPDGLTVSRKRLSAEEVAGGEWLTYTIRFRNKGTIPAMFVRITDTLSAGLDVASLEMISSSHPCRLLVRDKGTVDWLFDDIGLPVESRSAPHSHGFVSFRVKPRQTLNAGDTITNSAGICFNFNPPVGTNTVRTIIGKLSQSLAFAPVPDQIFGAAPFPLQASASSGLPVRFSVVAGPATLSGDTLSVSGTGPVTVQAFQAGDENHQAAPVIQQSFCVLPAKPLITAAGLTLASSSPAGNQWYRDGMAIAGATAQSYEATLAGAYSVAVTGSCGTGVSSDTLVVTVAGTEPAAGDDILIYPNPATERLVLELTDGRQFFSAVIADVNGREVASQTGANRNKAVFDTRTLRKGMYLLEVRTTRGVIRKKFLIR